MDLSKIKTLIDFVGQSNINELTVTEKETTVRIFRAGKSGAPAAGVSDTKPVKNAGPVSEATAITSPIFGLLHAASAPGEKPFVALGDVVEAGQTLFIIEAMKVFNNIVAPSNGRIVSLPAKDGGEVEVGDLLAEII
ncbi:MULTISPECIES: acetyl-CoA carboxylase biotin carboxyl carrier protein [Agrobacterium]|uniref:Biotin carboxyl carrier protein of acetyl-CoA carboxylase n=1 Tax=Agrobacterium rosae TaxID=1972867 RepID=A0A1R3TXG0_9HYPH|nr:MULTISPECIES: acetyl-CoA carboxylase biotin carboxyl carrier protein subunit [Agrobacterium]KAA3509621.1 acetyl-CoA carboxylase biotin carboxyl carrier protein subunit [Agrobacterium rosae]KAA3516522.1 acetyl-CoA carboxylase biotin carboxyl carrier protein subunit [Agrobacterium rosae]MCM2435038.1 acetyl-CoA carboxylase biotin carboxyl carrier protein subunit [Agrobacterium rosae]MDX8304943.1 acetyl-CoA carboxylase biotin carboxyl carrier protein subunit [Agrobacterium rosae]MDX8315463.1 ac